MSIECFAAVRTKIEEQKARRRPEMV